MTKGKRRLNYTKRKRILREHYSISQQQAREGEPPVASVTLDLSSYDLPSDARVFVDAYRHSTWQRFDCGTVRDIRMPEDRTLRDFGTGDGVRFRIRVVEAPSSDGEAHSRILAAADNIRPVRDGSVRSLLPMEPDSSLREEVWRLDIDENDGPLIRMSTHLVSDRHALARHPVFLSLVMPEVLRQILRWALEDGRPNDEEWDTPRGRWILQGCRLLGLREPPEELDDDWPEREQWIDQVVTQFCRRHGLGKQFGKWWGGNTSHAAGGEA
jgi:hypothetical protein